MSGLSAEWRTGRLLRLNTTNPAVEEYRKTADIETTPTFLLFDPDGNEVKRWVGKAPELSELPGATAIRQPPSD